MTGAATCWERSLLYTVGINELGSFFNDNEPVIGKPLGTRPAAETWLSVAGCNVLHLLCTLLVLSFDSLC